MRVYLLQIESRSLLSQAFGRLMDHPGVASCSIEPELGRLRFLVERGSGAGERLVERIYQEGGLAWCTRHEVTGPP